MVLRAMGWERQPEISGLGLSCGMPIHHAGRLPCVVVSPEASQDLSSTNGSGKAQGYFLYDFLCNLYMLLCGLNISPFLWREEKAYLMPLKTT